MNKIKEGYKQTELGFIPNDWEVKKFGEIINLITDYHSNGSYEILKDNVELLDTPDFAVMLRTTNFEKNDFSDFKYITESAYEFLSKSKVFKNDILMNKIANPGSVYYVPDFNFPMSLAMNLFLIRTNYKKSNHKFIYYYLKFNESYVKSFSNGTTTKTITKDAVRNLSITLPPLPEQKKIASILTTWDNAIEKTEKLIETKTKLKKALMQQLLTGKKRFKEFIKSNEYKQTELGLIPVDWELKKINSFLNESKIIGSNGKIAKKISVKLYGKGVFEKNEKYEGSINTKYYKRKAGQFIYSKLDFLNGAFGIIPEYLNNYESTLDLPTFDFNLNIIEKKYFLDFISRDVFYKMFQEGSIGSRKATRVSPYNFLNFEIPVPPLQEQEKIASVLTSCDKEIELLEKKLETLKNQKKGLMQKLLTGQIRVKV